MPEMIVKVVTDTSGLERGLNKAARTTNSFARDVERVGHGALVASFRFTGLGRAAAFASTQVLEGYALVEGVRKSLEVAQEAAVSQRSLAAQMKTSGESFAQNREQIERAGLSLAKFGFTSEDADRALVTLDRGTGSIRKSIGLLGVSADLARAKNLDLAAAANIVAKVFGGKTTALRRAVPGLDKNAKGWDLIREAQAKLAGQARAATTPQERFAAAVHDTERTIGVALLPTVNKYLGKATTWLSNTKNQEKIQKDLDTAIRITAGTVDVLTHSLEGLQMIMKPLEKTGFGFGAALFGIADKLGLVHQRSDPVAAQLQTINDELAAGTINATQYADALHKIERAQQTAFSALQGPVGTPFTPFKGTPPGVRGPSGRRTGPPTVEQRNQWFDAMISDLLDRAQDGTLRQQIGKLKNVEQLLKKQLKATMDVTRRRTREASLRGVFRAVAADESQLAQNAKDAAAKTAAAEKARRDALKKIAAEEVKTAKAAIDANNKRVAALRQQLLTGEQGRQFRALGLSATGDPRVPQVAADRRRLEQLRQRLTGTTLDTPKVEAMFRYISKVLAGQWGKVTNDSLKAIDDYFNQIAAKLGQGADHVAVVVAPKMNKLLAGLDLSSGQRRRLEYNIAGQHLTVGPGVHAATPITVHTHIGLDLDGKQIAAATRRQVVKTQQRTSTQTSGRQTR